MEGPAIRIRGARQNNLQDLDLDIPRYRLVGIAGLSGSGKSSLAFDTLYAEGQRRYVETFSAYARQFLERLDRPRVRSIENIPPAVAIDRKDPVRTSRSTVGTMTELTDHLKLLYARRAVLHCDGCGRPVEPAHPALIWQRLLDQWPGQRVVLGFAVGERSTEVLRSLGYDRLFDGRRPVDLEAAAGRNDGELWVLVDRLRLDEEQRSRFADSCELALRHGGGVLEVWNQEGRRLSFSSRLECAACGLSYSPPVSNLFSFNSPAGACPRCRGFGRIIDVDLDLVIPDPGLTLEQGAIKPWGGAAENRYEYRQLRLLCREEGIPLDVPWRRLRAGQRRKIVEGTASRYGIREFFDWVESKSYKMHVRVYLSRYRGYHPCPECRGARFRPETLRYRLGGRNLAEVLALSVAGADTFFSGLEFPGWDRAAAVLLEQISNRLGALRQVGLDYLTLDRQSRTLSGGEVQRVALAAALGTGLSETLYVLDEPSIGLHPRDNARLAELLRRLCRQRNTVVMVEHDPDLLAACDEIIELGPGAGAGGGRICARGSPGQVAGLTGDYLAGRRRVERRRAPARAEPPGWLHLEGVRAHNLAGIDVAIPLERLVCITGVSGSGKSTLLEEVLYKGLRWQQGRPAGRPGEFRRLRGAGLKRPVELVDQHPLGRTPRANLATYSGALGGIRKLLAGTAAARRRRLQARHFSFNVKGGRCRACRGEGYEKVEMQFLSDVFVPCPECGGRRFQPRVLEVTWQDRNIHQILELTVEQARQFFAGQRAIERALEPLVAVGLSYLPLGQSLNTISGGEAQRLKLSRYLAGRGQPGWLLLDEPTTGLHLADVQVLLDCLQRLLERGHSLVVVEHNLEFLANADWLIDLGPEGGEQGGRVVVAGTPEQVAACPESHTGRCLAPLLEHGLRGSSRVVGAPGAPAQSLPQAAEPAGDYGSAIEVRGARQHNLQRLDLDLPRGRLVAVSGVSGSGKSSLVFDVLFAEGQRRYLECLAPYVRQYMKVLERPEVDAVTGLPPTVAIEQRTAHAGPRSTVATLTEIYHYLRLLFARLARAHCPACGRALHALEPQGLVRRLVDWLAGQPARLLVTEVSARKGHHRERLARLRRRGVSEARIDGRLVELVPGLELARYRSHTIEAVLGRVAPASAGAESELLRALESGRGSLVAWREDGREAIFSTRGSCPTCGTGVEAADPLLFAFNHPRGACPRCHGSGRRGEDAESSCPDCRGGRLRPAALAYRLAGDTLPAVVSRTPGELRAWLDELQVEPRLQAVAEPLRAEIELRCHMLEQVGLDYLQLERSGSSLSGGEAQRVRLAAQLGSNLAGACYILDEPTIGLHPRDTGKLLAALRRLRDRGNTVVVVEHDEQTLHGADLVIELGPGGGRDGGQLLAVASPRDLAGRDTPTGRLLAGAYRPALPAGRPPARQALRLRGAKRHNLRHLDVDIPLGRLVCVTGVSGSGKSTLVVDTLFECLAARLGGRRLPPGRLRGLQSWQRLERVALVDHEPIGRTPRSVPATYIGAWDRVRRLLAATPAARARGFSPGRFSFNRTAGQCPSCRGFGVRKVEMNFLPDVYLPCASCGGRRFNSETLAVTYHGLDAGQLLELTFAQALEVFAAVPALRRAFQVVCDIGLDYLQLGQPSPTLSGGEAQRIKLAAELAGANRRPTMFLLDEPTTGLHGADVGKLLVVLQRLVEQGHSVVVIEHNLEFIAQADWVLELGPAGGAGGGRLLFAGTPAELTARADTPTARALAEFLPAVAA